MRNLRICPSILMWFACVCLVAFLVVFPEESRAVQSQDETRREQTAKGDMWVRKLEDRSKRGTLHDAFQNVRGDHGRWSDEPLLVRAPSLTSKPAKTSLDDWFDQNLSRKDLQIASGEEHWVLIRTRQLDDNDRVWVSEIQRRGNQFNIELSEAIWQGRYFKTFTYYDVYGINLGKLEPGKYEATLVIKPLTFKQFEGDGRPVSNLPKPTNNLPKDERTAETKPVRLQVMFDAR